MVFALVCGLTIASIAQVQLDYYLPSDIAYNTDVPTPESVIGHEVGEWLVTHDKLLLYMQTIANISDRAVAEIYGYSYEDRPLMHLIISSPENIRNLDILKNQHQQLTEPSSSDPLNIQQ